MELTKRQTIFLLVTCLLANKVQRLPSLVATELGRHGYLLFLLMGLFDTLMLLVCLGFNKLAGHRTTTYIVLEKTGTAWFSKFIYIIFAIYFLFNALLPYEAIHDMFASVLFDNLTWEIYSLLMVLAVFFMASRGLKALGRLYEVFFFLIIGSFAILLTMGAATTNFSRVMPLADLDIGGLAATCFEYNLWFGDFLIIYMFVGKIKQDDGFLGWPIIVAQVVCTLVLTFAYIIFYGLYENLAPNQNSLISSISLYSLLGLNIGRVDWFFVLFFQIGAVLCAGTYLFAAAYCLYEVFSRHHTKGVEQSQFSKGADKKARKMLLILIALVIIIYIADTNVFKSNQQGVAILKSITKYLGVFMVAVLPFILLITAAVYHKKRKKQDKNIQNSFKNLVFVKKTAKIKKGLPKSKAKLKTMRVEK